MQNSIRPYTEDDKESLLAIFRLNTPDYFDPKEIKDFRNYLERHGKTYLTVWEGNEIAGGTGYYVNENDRSGRITWIFLAPNHSGKGLGKKAVEYCHRLLRKDERVEKFVVTTSQHAYRFFEKFGYRIIRIEQEYWGEGLDLYEMEMIGNEKEAGY